MNGPADRAQLALLLEVAGTPKPGNVDRDRDLPDLLFEHFLAGAIGARPGLELAEAGDPIGTAFERAVEGMATQRGGNTQFGALLLLIPLVRAAAEGMTRPQCESVVDETSVSDAASFYRAFDHVDVAVGDPPPDAPALDVRRGADAIPAVRERGLDLQSVLELGVPGDDVAREWVTGFERSFAAADRFADRDGPIADRAGGVYLSLLAERPDTLVATRHGESVAADVHERAATLADRNAFERDRTAVADFADDLVAAGINPGTTADLTAAGLFIALERESITV
ncbi:triphosphoribosyl-dephospho-CoA protein [Halovivax asiaticus JCM 14624]|uniref:Triphosphoribosyl-dephospho-CoA protein n=1 Tax=Halovivax asiaticus JCM 14624 TaxID=1227490 RepID=M0BT89_9EURY|nr:triphosphoribosyl-dephospho-CoA synthase [Halovivax asiaticus]ELZ14246.1 triphosphoribosyl-dephospho-CoA protein [Halovivax asiaticus JCM 14624]